MGSLLLAFPGVSPVDACFGLVENKPQVHEGSVQGDLKEIWHICPQLKKINRDKAL